MQSKENTTQGVTAAQRKVGQACKSPSRLFAAAITGSDALAIKSQESALVTHLADLGTRLPFCNVTRSQLDQTCKNVQQQHEWKLIISPHNRKRVNNNNDKSADSYLGISSSGGIRCTCSPSAPAPPSQSAATWVAHPHPKVLIWLPTFSSSQIPAGEARHSSHYQETHPAAPAMVNEVVQSNFLEGPQGSRNPNGENRRVNKTESGGWCSSGWKKLFLKALQTQYECKLFENIYSAGVRFYCACGEGE